MQTPTRSVIKRSKADKTEESAFKAKQLKNNPLKIELPTVETRNKIIVSWYHTRMWHQSRLFMFQYHVPTHLIPPLSQNCLNKTTSPYNWRSPNNCKTTTVAEAHKLATIHFAVSNTNSEIIQKRQECQVEVEQKTPNGRGKGNQCEGGQRAKGR